MLGQDRIDNSNRPLRQHSIITHRAQTSALETLPEILSESTMVHVSSSPSCFFPALHVFNPCFHYRLDGVADDVGGTRHAAAN